LRRRMVMLVVPHSGMNPANFSGALNGDKPATGGWNEEEGAKRPN
jgi:hypothetical protein